MSAICEDCGHDFLGGKSPLPRDAQVRVPSEAARPTSGSLRTPAGKTELLRGDCLRVMDDMAENSIDALVTDPPAGISFMRKGWDGDKGGKRQWVKWLSSVMQTCRHVLKPGAHGLVWALPRTSHWTMDALEDAGFEIRGKVYHIHAQGFPKGVNLGGGRNTALKPAVEEWILCRKPLSEKTHGANVRRWGVGGVNIDRCRFGPGRYPADLTHDGSPEVLAEFARYGVSKSSAGLVRKGHVIGNGLTHGPQVSSRDCRGGYDDEGGIARFFYCAKASAGERDFGCEGLPAKTPEQMTGRKRGSPGLNNPRAGTCSGARANHHPTIKPVALMSYLCRLVTPACGTVLDCFMGSGSTGVAAVREGFRFFGIEQEQEYFQIAQARLSSAEAQAE